ncbi:hypothetical protein B9W73_01295 [Lactococcus lactis]|uniref:hypothetical protein n=1 Tax=Lactococcus lactis TaxID=1358 RepID=UPI000A1E1502|nr:hypothetical protein [Lactococcus lactis]OSP88546.1 hypothetical protein B9W73_01295 [Lactococcus lactis]
MKKIAIITVSILALLILGACGSQKSNTTSSTKEEKSAKVTNKSSQTENSTQSSSSQQIQSSQSAQESATIDTRNLSVLQFKQWIAMYEGEEPLDNRPERIYVFNSESDGRMLANTEITTVKVDSRDSFVIDENGFLKSLDFSNYPNMKVSSKVFPTINQKKLNEKEILYWVVEAQDKIFASESIDPRLSVNYDVVVHLENNLVYADVLKIDYSENPNGGAAIANKTKINEFMVNANGELEMMDKTDNSRYITISKIFMDTSMIK